MTLAHFVTGFAICSVLAFIAWAVLGINAINRDEHDVDEHEIESNIGMSTLDLIERQKQDYAD